MKQLSSEEYEQRALMLMVLTEVEGDFLKFEGNYYNGKRVIAFRYRDDHFRYKVSDPWKLQEFDADECFWNA